MPTTAPDALGSGRCLTQPAPDTDRLSQAVRSGLPPLPVVGVYRLKHTGVSYVIHSNCTTSPEKRVVSYSPHRVGWYLWES